MTGQLLVARRAAPGAGRSRGTSLALGVVRLYQRARTGRLSPCRYVPSCSDYAVESLERHGLFRGTWLAARRVSRCRPLGRYGFDPVPD